jgi:SOS-response transcriptional repressor LexA
MSRKINVNGEKIAHARELRGKQWTQEKIAEELTHAGLEVSRMQVANWESGRTRGMSLPVLTVLAQLLNKPVSYFADDAAVIQEEKGRIPVVGVVNAERFNFSFGAPPETTLPLRLDMAGDRRAVALRISGDCMVNPKDPQGSLYPGDYVIIVEQNDCPNGAIAVVRLNGEFTLKRVFKVKDHFELRPDNPAYKPIIVKSGDLHIVGVKLAKYSP